MIVMAKVPYCTDTIKSINLSILSHSITELQSNHGIHIPPVSSSSSCSYSSTLKETIPFLWFIRPFCFYPSIPTSNSASSYQHGQISNLYSRYDHLEDFPQRKQNFVLFDNRRKMISLRLLVEVSRSIIILCQVLEQVNPPHRRHILVDRGREVKFFVV